MKFIIAIESDKTLIKIDSTISYFSSEDAKKHDMNFGRKSKIFHKWMI